MERTWEMVVEAEHPIAVSGLEVIVTQGKGLEIPLRRSDFINEINAYWNTFTCDMAVRQKEKIRAALESGADAAYIRAIKHIAGISSMYRLNSALLDGSRLILNIGVTDFKEYIGTTQRALFDLQFRSRLIAAGMEDCGSSDHYFANPLSTCAVLVSADGYIPIGFRAKSVAIYPETYHTIGGYVKVNSGNKACFSEYDVDPFKNMKKELEGEMGVHDTDFTSVEFLGIARNRITRGPEALYVVRFTLSRDELIKRWRTKAEDHYEHKNLTFYTNSELLSFIEQYRGNIVPSGEAAFTLFAKHYC